MDPESSDAPQPTHLLDSDGDRDDSAVSPTISRDAASLGRTSRSGPKHRSSMNSMYRRLSHGRHISPRAVGMRRLGRSPPRRPGRDGQPPVNQPATDVPLPWTVRQLRCAGLGIPVEAFLARPAPLRQASPGGQTTAGLRVRGVRARAPSSCPRLPTRWWTAQLTAGREIVRSTSTAAPPVADDRRADADATFREPGGSQ